jgi:hypothetical protein
LTYFIFVQQNQHKTNISIRQADIIRIITLERLKQKSAGFLAEGILRQPWPGEGGL